jgi:hypothetical protein
MCLSSWSYMKRLKRLNLTETRWHSEYHSWYDICRSKDGFTASFTTKWYPNTIWPKTPTTRFIRPFEELGPSREEGPI